MASPTFLSDGSTPRRTDAKWVILQKILGAEVDGLSGAGAVQVYEGRDPAPPDNIAKAALNYPSGGGSLTQWDIVTQAWV